MSRLLPREGLNNKTLDTKGGGGGGPDPMVQSQISIRKSKDKHHKTSPVLMDLITSQKISVGAKQSKARQAPNFWLEKDN